MAGSWAGTHYTGDSTNETVTGTAAAEWISSFAGNDVVRAGDGADSLDGGIGDDRLLGEAGNDLLYDVGGLSPGVPGVPGQDTLMGGDGDDAVQFYALSAGDRADGGAGLDTLTLRFDFQGAVTTRPVKFLLAPNATCLVGGVANLTVLNFERVTITSGRGNDVLQGGDLADVLNAGNGRDRLLGFGGDDLLTQGQGVGRLYGGDGNDQINFVQDLGAGPADPGDFADGGAGNDRINFALNTSNTAFGQSGDDFIFAQSDFKIRGAANHFYGGDGNDTMGGGDGADHLFGGQGNDNLSATPWVQEILGGAGNDLIGMNGGAADPVPAGQVLDGGQGQDTLSWVGNIRGDVDWSAGDYTTVDGTLITGFEVFDLTVVCQTDSSFTLGDGDDGLWAQSNDALVMHSGDGNDFLRAASPDLLVDCGAGNDTILLERGSGTLRAGAGNDQLYLVNALVKGDATLDGGAGTDFAAFGLAVNANLALGTATTANSHVKLIRIEALAGSGLNDTLIGNAQDNRFYGGNTGQDSFTTGKGADTVLISAIQTGTAHVTDFDPTRDHIGLNNFANAFVPLPLGPLDAARFVLGHFATAPVSTISGPQFFYDHTTGHLWMDRDGTGTAAPVLALVLDTLPDLTAADLVVEPYL